MHDSSNMIYALIWLQMWALQICAVCSVTLFDGDLEEAPAEGGAQLLGSHQGVPAGPLHVDTICNNAAAGSISERRLFSAMILVQSAAGRWEGMGTRLW